MEEKNEGNPYSLNGWIYHVLWQICYYNLIFGVSTDDSNANLLLRHTFLCSA